jgi:hypothetical protein
VTIHTETCGQICLVQGWQNFLRDIPKIPINFEKILLLAHGNFEEQNKVLVSSTITTNIALIIVINA